MFSLVGNFLPESKSKNGNDSWHAPMTDDKKASELAPPERTQGEVFLEFSKGGAGAIPFVGGIGAATLETLFGPWARKHRTAWERSMAEAITKIQKKASPT